MIIETLILAVVACWITGSILDHINTIDLRNHEERKEEHGEGE